MLQTVFELAFKEELSIAIQLPIPLEDCISPLALVFEGLIEDEDSESITESSVEGAFVVVPVLIVGLPFAMGLAIFPVADVLNDVILFLRLVHQFPLAVEGPSLEVPLIPRSVSEGIDSMSVLFVILPIPRVGIPICIAINSITMFLLASYAPLIAIAVAEILDRYHLRLHFLCKIKKRL
jgi:hypothetical protein